MHRSSAPSALMAYGVWAAAEQLKTVIRVTLPTEAALVDVAPRL
jgi:hypothetical protein